MNTEIISDKQGIMLMTLFIMGSTLVLGAGGEAKQDIWIATLLALVFAVPILFVYARLLSIFHGKDLFDILIYLFGKYIGRLIALLFAWYALHLGALVIRNFSEFIRVVAMPETPRYMMAIFMGVLSVWAVKDGIELLSRFATVVLPITLIAIILLVLLAVTVMDFSNFKPVLYDGIKPVAKGAFAILTFPLAETVIFTMAFRSLNNKRSPYRVYFLSLVIAVTVLLIATVRNILVLGAELLSTVYFASYTVIRIVNIGDFLQRMEVMVAIIFLFAGFIKVSICLYAASNGISKIFDLGDYRGIVFPIGLLMMVLSGILYDSTMAMVEWASEIYMYYAIPFQIILPCIILMVAEIKIRYSKKVDLGQ